MKLIILSLLVLSLTACLPMSDERASRAIEGQGYTDVQLQGMAVFGCSDDDFFRKKFSATGVNGQPVSGVVCGGILKGATVRTD